MEISDSVLINIGKELAQLRHQIDVQDLRLLAIERRQSSPSTQSVITKTAADLKKTELENKERFKKAEKGYPSDRKSRLAEVEEKHGSLRH